MKAIVIVMIMTLVGCATFQPVSIKERTPQVGVEVTVLTGDVLFESIDCYGEEMVYSGSSRRIVHRGECSRYDLTVAGVFKDKIMLQYREYMKCPSRWVPSYLYDLDAPWCVKDAFTRDLEYSTESSHIKYKSHSFRILSVTDNGFTYVAE